MDLKKIKINLKFVVLYDTILYNYITQIIKMVIVNKIAKIREKLDLYWKRYIDSFYLQKILDKFAPNYTISNLVSKWFIIPIKRWKIYINKFSKEIVYPYIVWDLYMWDDLYVFWWLSIYNKYNLTEQIASKYTIYNTKFSWEKVIWKINFIFVKQRESFFYWSKKEKFEWDTYYIMSQERAFIQMLKENKIFNELPSWINKEKLLKMVKKYSSKTIISKIEKLCI